MSSIPTLIHCLSLNQNDDKYFTYTNNLWYQTHKTILPIKILAPSVQRCPISVYTDQDHHWKIVLYQALQTKGQCAKYFKMAQWYG